MRELSRRKFVYALASPWTHTLTAGQATLSG